MQVVYDRCCGLDGHKRTVVAVTQTLQGIIYHLLTHPEASFQDLGATYFDHRD
jgi:hypothetical protein